ncbi:MAG: hypothetical protein ACE14V_13865 [bacterium]
MRALIWKEWRENWVILIMAIGVICLLAYLLEINREFNPAVNDIKTVFYFIPLFIVIITTNLFSSEFGKNTMPLLLSQPISRAKLWVTKVGFGIFFILLLMLGSSIGIYYISKLTPHPVQLQDLVYDMVKDQYTLMMLLSLFYASGLVISVIVSNSISATFGSLIFCGCITFLWLFIGNIFFLAERWYGSLWILILLLLWISYYIFTRPEILIAKQRIKSSVYALAFGLLIYVFIAALIQSNSHDPFYQYNQIVNITPKIVIPSKNIVVASISKSTGERCPPSTRLGLIPLDNTKKYTFLPRGYFYEGFGAISPDRKSMILFNARKLFGLIECRLFNKKAYRFDLSALNIRRYSLKGEGVFHEINDATWDRDGKNLNYSVVFPFARIWQSWRKNIENGKDKLINSSKDDPWFFLSERKSMDDDYLSYFILYPSYNKEQRALEIRQVKYNFEGKALSQMISLGSFPTSYFSPDNKWYFYCENTNKPIALRNIYLRYNSTGKSICILSMPNIKSWSYSPDSQWIAISSNSTSSDCEIWLVNLATKEKRVLISERNCGMYIRGWTNDNCKIIFDLYQDTENINTGRVFDIYTNTIQEIPLPYDMIYTNLPLPDGNFLITKNNILYKISLDGKTKQQLYP